MRAEGEISSGRPVAGSARKTAAEAASSNRRLDWLTNWKAGRVPSHPREPPLVNVTPRLAAGATFAVAHLPSLPDFGEFGKPARPTRRCLPTRHPSRKAMKYMGFAGRRRPVGQQTSLASDPPCPRAVEATSHATKGEKSPTAAHKIFSSPRNCTKSVRET